MEGELEGNFVPFQTLTEEAVASDQNNRQVIRAQTQRTRQTAQLVLAIASFGTVSLVLLLAAYLASDLFAPLREVRQALDDLAAGDLERRLDEERADELGAINRAFNHMAEAIQQREQVVQLAAVPAGVAEEGANGSAWQYMPSRLMLHRLVSQLRSRVTQLGSDNELDGDGAVVTQHQQELVSQLDRLLQVVSRLTEFGFPLDLNLARTDIRALLYEVLLRFHDDFARRAISFELDISPAIGYAIVDRLKLREALGELVRNALAAIPESGGRLGLRTSITADGTQLLIEVADNGTGAEQPLINRAFSMREIGGNQRPGVGLKLTKAIVEQHGGHLDIDSRPGVGTYVQIKLPLRE
jgi:two-component system OmpR family sensor kinase